MPLRSHDPNSAIPIRAPVRVVSLPAGSSRRSRSRARRKRSSSSGGERPPAGPLLHGPCPFPPPGWLFQAMNHSGLNVMRFRCRSDWFPEALRLYVQLPRGATKLGPVFGQAGRRREGRTMAMATRDAVLEALRRVVDPATGRNIVESDMVQGLVLRD